jgi:tetratricopeptide (TPR) repeat protein
MASIWHNLGIVYQTTKQYSASQDAYANAIRIYETSPGAATQLLSCLRSYADVLRKLERFNEAERADLEASKVEVHSAIEADKTASSPTASFRP